MRCIALRCGVEGRRAAPHGTARQRTAPHVNAFTLDALTYALRCYPVPRGTASDGVNEPLLAPLQHKMSRRLQSWSTTPIITHHTSEIADCVY